MAKPPDIRPTHNRALPPGHVVGRLSGNDPTRSADGRLISMDDLAHAMIGTGRIASSAVTLRYFKLANQRAQRAAGVALMYQGDGDGDEINFVLGAGAASSVSSAYSNTLTHIVATTLQDAIDVSFGVLAPVEASLTTFRGAPFTCDQTLYTCDRGY